MTKDEITNKIAAAYYQGFKEGQASRGNSSTTEPIISNVDADNQHPYRKAVDVKYQSALDEKNLKEERSKEIQSARSKFKIVVDNTTGE